LEKPDRCPCGSQTLEGVDLSGKGKVYTCTTLYAAAEPFENDLPFQIAIVELDEGPRLTVRIEGRRVAIEDAVHLVREQDGTRFFAGD
jgi:uncharacterized OB-fold protein